MLKEIIESVIESEKKSVEKIWSQPIIGNFYSGGMYQQSMDLIFILAKDSKEAKKIAHKYINIIQDHFKNKILYNGKKPALQKSEKSIVRVGNDEAKLTDKTTFHKVLTSKGKFENISLK